MDLLRIIAERDGFFTRTQAEAAGYESREITKIVRDGVWRRIRRGVYVYADVWDKMTLDRQHLIRTKAVVHSLGDNVALSHQTGMLWHGIDIWGVRLDRIHVTRLDGGAGRIQGDVIHHEGFWTDADVMVVDGVQVLRPERCVLEAASRSSAEVTQCLFDAGLRAQKYDRRTFERRYALMEHWPFMHRVRPLVSLADGRSGSIGESRGTFLFRRLGIPRPELQFEVRRDDGSVAGITDWAWHEQRLLGEFDGRVKYGRLLKPGQDPGDVVFDEKTREDELRELTGYGMIRLIWSDYESPRRVDLRLRRALRLAG